MNLHDAVDAFRIGRFAPLRGIASADALTGLANRRLLDTVFEVESANAVHDDSILSCVMLDVDHFKQFNDRFGHDAGDAVLRGVSEILRSSVRESGLAFRYGGEEFALLRPELDVDEAQARAETIRQRISLLNLSHN